MQQQIDKLCETIRHLEVGIRLDEQADKSSFWAALCHLQYAIDLLKRVQSPDSTCRSHREGGAKP